jgi:hypothetical protein
VRAALTPPAKQLSVDIMTILLVSCGYIHGVRESHSPHTDDITDFTPSDADMLEPLPFEYST